MFESEVQKHHGDKPNFQYKDENGAPIGPFAVLSYTPDLFQSFMALGDAILNQPGLAPRSRELAILAVTAVYDVPFVMYAHSRIASTAGFSEEQVTLACEGTTPTGLTESEVITYETALDLARSKGSLDENSWLVAQKELGKENAARLAHVVGLYLYVGAILRLGAIRAPNQGKS